MLFPMLTMVVLSLLLAGVVLSAGCVFLAVLTAVPGLTVAACIASDWQSGLL